ncbi:hypothetical protein [Wenxinia marina]|uniref:Uncharacterized protein n=1 Tax=Wenxinia marina DSM 24838 TaxID=1123501 RepID=A0A0D0Q8Z0_9RHOB|nr:hypothetical protein [Wenxinia marina]KIQ68842.1 hypothetical protein Wenmar_02571 [Wenxinia marina DSM 24838]GGL64784.1 hypothetical protein GCM10011392_19300 [Wenxinia marina]
MRALPLLPLALAACTPGPTGELPVGTGFPVSYRGMWSPAPDCVAAASAAGTVRIGETTLEGLDNLCRLVRATPAAGGGLLAEMTCTARGRTRTELARLALSGGVLSYRSAEGRADWSRCS